MAGLMNRRQGVRFKLLAFIEGILVSHLSQYSGGTAIVPLAIWWYMYDDIYFVAQNDVGQSLGRGQGKINR